MLYHLFEYIENQYGLPGASLFQFITFRAGAAIILSLLISLLLGDRIIRSLKRKQIGESIRDLGLDGQIQKEGTPTMGGIIILISILIPCLLFAKLDNVYIQLMLVVTILMGTIGFIDDYIKVFRKDKKGLHGRFKIIGQVLLGLLVALTMIFSKDVVVRKKGNQVDERYTVIKSFEQENTEEKVFYVKSYETNVPFLKLNTLDYSRVLNYLGTTSRDYAWLLFIPLTIFIVTAVSNAANLTDGIDGLASGVSAIIAATIAVLAYVSGNTITAEYLNILFIPYSSELVIYSACLLGGCIGFLWYNAYPARVFMGDTGSLAVGGIIAVLAILLRKELLIPLLCGIFVLENISVVMQVAYFKYTRRKYGEGRRIFRMAPIHHHFQKIGMHESKIVTRFWIVGIMLAVLTIITLKIR